MTGRSTEVPDAALAARLVADQFGSTDPVVEVARGWDNVVLRLGDRHVVRMPVRDVAVPLLLNEIRWLGEISAPLPVPTPVPEFVGEPGHGYPWPWTVAPWLDGQELADLPVTQRGPVAEDLAAVFAALHRPAPADAPANRVRGVPLAERAEVVRARIAGWHGSADEREVLAETYEAALAAPSYDGQPVWLHGDPHPANLLVEGGRLSGVIDFGDLTAGDPANDLAAAWWCFDASARARFRDLLGDRHDDATWTRAAGWAASWVSAIGPDDRLVPIARHTLEELRRG